MSSRYGSNLHTRDLHYDRQRADLYGQASERYGSASPGYSYSSNSNRASPAPGYGYNHSGSSSPATVGYRAATPNRKGQYSAAVMEELESQNEAQVEGLSAKVRMLKDITVAIGEEVRSSTGLMETMNEGFEGTRQKLQGTMKNMMRMARRTGVGWMAWMAFFAAVVVLFWWVWI